MRRPFGSTRAPTSCSRSALLTGRESRHGVHEAIRLYANMEDRLDNIEGDPVFK
jgi:hypothetical protein